MVKTKTGGKRSKGLARKQQTHDPAEQLHRGNVRTKEDVIKETKGMQGSYYYAKVLKSFGNCRFAVLCDDGVERIASCMHFAKKNRRDNNIEIGSKLLVGVADYHANVEGKMQQSQSLELYTAAEVLCIPYFQDEDEDEDDVIAREVDIAMTEDVVVGDFDDI